MKLDLPKRTMMLYNFNDFFFLTLLLSEGKTLKTKDPKKNNKRILIGISVTFLEFNISIGVSLFTNLYQAAVLDGLGAVINAR